MDLAAHADIAASGFPRYQDWFSRVLLVDDDPVFCELIRRKARDLHLDLSVCKSRAELLTIPNHKQFDVAILDFYFDESLNALEVAKLLPPEIPIVIVSSTEGRKLSGASWPSAVRTFVHKSAGADSILNNALLAAHWGDLAASFPGEVKLPRILLVDDDPVFGMILRQTAEKAKLPLTHILSPAKLDIRKVRDNYDLLISDYDLENVTGVQLTRQLETFGQSLPTILISAYGKLPDVQLPNSILCSLQKAEGPQKILYTSLNAYQQI